MPARASAPNAESDNRVVSTGAPAASQLQPPGCAGAWGRSVVPVEVVVVEPPVADPPLPEPELELDPELELATRAGARRPRAGARRAELVLDEPPPTQTLPEHVSVAPQVPQLSVPPQPSATVPQLSPAGQVGLGVQPHTVGGCRRRRRSAARCRCRS